MWTVIDVKQEKDDNPISRFDAAVLRLSQRLTAFERGALRVFGGRRFETEMAVERFRLQREVARTGAPDSAAPDDTSDLLTERGDRQSAVTLRRVRSRSGLQTLAEVTTTPGGKRALQMLDLAWTAQTTQLAMDTYGLSAAEAEICRAYLACCDIRAVAEQRGTSEGTVRQQIKSIYAKTQTASQAQLVRILAILCTRAHGPPAWADWSDPFDRECLFTDYDGRQLAYTQIGARAGRPAILVHGPMTGYVLPAAVEAALADANITLWAISRPGFGNSEPDLDRPAIDAGARSVVALMDHLGISACPGIGIICGLAPLARLAGQQPDRVTGLLGVGAAAPLDASQPRDHLPMLQRVVLELARLSPTSLEVVFLRGVLASAKDDIAAVLHRMYGQCTPDRAVLDDPETLSRLSRGARMILARDPKVFLRDLDMMSAPWRDDLRRANVPCAMIAGAEDPIFPPGVVRRLGTEANVALTVLEGAGQLIAFQYPDQIAKAIIDLVA